MNESIDLMSQDELKDKLFQSEGWLAFRFDPEKGIFIHYKDDKSMYLVPMFLAHNDKMWEFVKETVEEMKNQMANAKPE